MQAKDFIKKADPELLKKIGCKEARGMGYRTEYQAPWGFFHRSTCPSGVTPHLALASTEHQFAFIFHNAFEDISKAPTKDWPIKADMVIPWLATLCIYQKAIGLWGGNRIRTASINSPDGMEHTNMHGKAPLMWRPEQPAFQKMVLDLILPLLKEPKDNQWVLRPTNQLKDIQKAKQATA